MTHNLVICGFSEQRFMILNLCTFLGHPVQDSPVILINYYAPNDESSQVRVLLEINRIVTSLDLEQNTSMILP